MIAADVMTREVVSVGPDVPVGDVAKLLLAHRISAVPVIDDTGALLGIVSEGDLLRRHEAGTEGRRSWWLQLVTDDDVLAREYVKSHGRRAADVMTRQVFTVGEATPLADVAALLERHHVKRVPVVAERRILGIVSRANLLQAMAVGEAAQAGATDDEAIRGRILAELDAQPWARRWPKSVLVRNGVAHLWGRVESEEERTAFRVAAENVAGVKAVKDHLETAPKPVPF